MSSVGKPVPRNDAYAKATGKALFVGDLYLPGMLYAKIKRSDYAHAKILRIDTTKASKIPGVRCIATAKDIPGNNIVPVVFRDLVLLAEDKVRFYGEPIAVVAADTPEIAEEACEKIIIEYEELEPLLDPLSSRTSHIKLWKDDNTFQYYCIRKGNIEEGFREADVIIERTYKTPYQEHAYLEPQGMLAIPLPYGGMEIRGSMQCPFYVQEAVAEVLGIDLAQVRVIQMETGGGFGGKEDVPSIVGAQAALAAHLTGKPVKLIYSREEDIISMSKRHPGHIKYKLGATKDGRLVAAEVEYIINAGAYATLSPIVLYRGTIHSCGAYVIPNVKVDSYAVATNMVPCGAFRGFGSPQVLFAVESIIDELAAELNMDPVELRRKNLLRPGERTATNQLLDHSVGIHECLDKVVQASQWDEKRKRYPEKIGKKLTGIGVSTIMYGVGLGAAGKFLDRTGAYVSLLADGTAQVAVGTTEMGQGMKTVLAQIAADELGIPFESVVTIETDTSRVPDSGPTVASRSTTMSGRAIRKACIPIRENLLTAASNLLKVERSRIKIEYGKIFVDGKPTEVPLKEVIREAMSEKLQLTYEGYDSSPLINWDPKTGIGDAYIVFAFAANVAEVTVDTRTCEVTVKNIWAAHDIGRAINPQTAEGQIEGGSVQGMGYAIMEEILYDKKGKMLNPNFSTYILPTALDAPWIEPFIIEHPYREGPFGAKGFGEQPLMGIAPAIVNAIFNATGKRLYEIPATPERLFQLLKGGK